MWPSVALLQSLLQQCENELTLIDMAINTKSPAACVLVQEMTMCVCVCVCAKLTMCDGSELSWVDEIRYLGVLLPDPENLNARLITLNAPSTVPLTAFLVKLGD